MGENASGPNSGALTLVLVGRTGNGKSATGNTILGRKAFKSKPGSSGVTRATELQTTQLRDGRLINVVDTPGLFDLSAGSDFIGKEIVKCIDLSKDGIHAVILVLSVRTRFSEEEAASIRSLQILFGNKIVDYTIVVFSGGDELEDNDDTLEDYLGHECPVPLKDILLSCKNRCLLFDNRTKDERKRVQQVEQLFSLVDTVVMQNGGQPYTHGMFPDLKVEAKLQEVTSRIEQQLAEEHAARLKAEETAQQIQKETGAEIRRLNEQLSQAREAGRRNGGGGICVIV